MSSNGRLQGRLEVSRAFGDRQFKKVLLLLYPLTADMLCLIFSSSQAFLLFSNV